MRKPTPEPPRTRRGFLETALVAGWVVVGCAKSPSKANEPSSRKGEADEAEVTPGEDLMQEHGVIERILLVYDEASQRIESGRDFDARVVAKGASIVRRFVEDYHEKQEEDSVFPRLEKAHQQVELVRTLRVQHDRGRRLTDDIVRLAASRPDAELARALRSFARMYRPHAAREDTVLFPAFRELVGRDGYEELGESFEEHEHRLFGEHGFEDIVKRVSELEQALGIGELESFTPT